MISVICPSYRNPKYLNLFLKSATRNNVLDDTEIIVILDGYPEESREVCSKYPGVSVLELPENNGMQTAINYGVYQANNEYVLILNDDNVMCTNYDIRLKEQILKINTKFGDKWVLTVDQVETEPGMFYFDVANFGKTVEEFRYDDWIKYEHENKSPVDYIREDGHIFPFVVQKKWFMAVGGFDTYYNSPNIVDWDMFLKFELFGFVFPRTRALRFYHFGSVATKKNSESSNFIQRERMAIEQYRWKWGVNPYNAPGSNSKVPPNRKFRGFQV